MIDDMKEKQLEKIFKALANKRRIAIVKYVYKHKAGEATVGEISRAIKLSFKSTSRHLAVLNDADIIDREQRNIEVYYFLSAQKHPIIKQLLVIL